MPKGKGSSKDMPHKGMEKGMEETKKSMPMPRKEKDMPGHGKKPMAC